VLGDVLCFSHLRWEFVFQRPNHLMQRCARDRRVFFLEEPVFDLPTGSASELATRRLSDGPHVVVPHLAAQPRESGERVERELRKLLDRLVVDVALRPSPVLWFYTPMALGWARHLATPARTGAVVYDCMDELSLFRAAPPALGDRERELFTLADVVFTGGHGLYEAKRLRHPSVHAFPSSVDGAHFGQATGWRPEPPDQAGLPRPRAGFFGVIDERMDVGLLDAVARVRPDLELVMIGPTAKIDPKDLPRRKNLRWLGPRPYASLPHYLAGWDVALMPFARNDATRFISPTKTLEYLAAGKPIVSTSIRDVVRPYGEQGIVRIADAPAAFAAAIDAALADRGTLREAKHREACARTLAATSWDTTWSQMWALVQSRAARRSHPSADVHEAAPCSTA
jgi:UDP-galactopyranose mutase